MLPLLRLPLRHILLVLLPWSLPLPHAALDPLLLWLRHTVALLRHITPDDCSLQLAPTHVSKADWAKGPVSPMVILMVGMISLYRMSNPHHLIFAPNAIQESSWTCVMHILHWTFCSSFLHRLSFTLCVPTRIAMLHSV